MDKTFEVIIGNQRITAYANIRGDQLAPGDLYIAKRNTGWHLAKCLYVNHEDGWVMPDPPASIYSYNCRECAKVKSVEEITGDNGMDEIERMWNAFNKYKETAEQHEFMRLFVLDAKLTPAYNDLKKNFTDEHAAIFKRVMQQVFDALGIKEW